MDQNNGMVSTSGTVMEVENECSNTIRNNSEAGGDFPPVTKKHRIGRPINNNTTNSSVESSRAPTPNVNDGNDDSLDAITYLQSLTMLPNDVPLVRKLSDKELEELEKVFEFTGPKAQESWREDWAGNLALADKDILNPSMSSKGSGKHSKSFRQPLILWAVHSDSNSRYLRNLLRYVCTMDLVPVAVTKILGGVNPSTSVEEMTRLIRRASYDPQVLREDGWTTEKADEPVGATGGAYRIGQKIRSDGSDAAVIAYVHDPDIGDLWKALWMDDFVSFDLEAEELLEARRKWERRYNNNLHDTATGKMRRSTRVAVNSEFTVKGIEYGIVLGASFSRGARPGVYWPARMMHASESGLANSQGRRNSSKQKVDLVFLAPYWSSDVEITATVRKVRLSDCGQSMLDENPLLLWETIDASDEMVKEYPYSTTNGLDMTQLQLSFRFTGLPKSVFGRYIDAHRLAMGLKLYAKRHLKSQYSETDKATAGLFETHPMSVQAPTFPSVVLHLPFGYILSQLPKSNLIQSNDNQIEPVLKLDEMIKAMIPPHCWGNEGKDGTRDSIVSISTPINQAQVDLDQPLTWLKRSTHVSDSSDFSSVIENFLTSFPLLHSIFKHHTSSPHLEVVLSCLTNFFAHIAYEGDTNNHCLTAANRKSKLRSLITSWTILKRLGEDNLALLIECNKEAILAEWRKAVERIYKYVVGILSDKNVVGNGVTTIVTDPRCNDHRTSTGCFERPVRLPAAIKAAKMAGAGRDESTKLISSIPDKYIDLVEKEILTKAHDSEYLKRMKARCAATKHDSDVIVLTDDSDGEGGEDTRGSRGTWKAAVTGVAGAIYCADLVVRGECVNGFCIIRPPGHHAGRSLHPMKAVSNGFCILNSVACTALYATTPLLEGGLGLSRVCIIDFDVHHGNGTQDILCSTFDPRFLYISLHAGGAEVNGHSKEDDPNYELNDLGSNPKMAGIYPGRCGDTSPHKGVLNIPLGAKVTAHAVGTSLINLVSPRVELFSPDLIILSAGFDAHKSDPMGLGGLRAEDFGHITQVACQIAFKSCSGRVVSVLEGGYGVPCCRPQKDLFMPESQLITQKLVEPTNLSRHVLANEQTTGLHSGSASGAPREPQTFTQISIIDKTGTSTFTWHLEERSEHTKNGESKLDSSKATTKSAQPARPQPSKLLVLDEDLPDDMDDQIPYALQLRLEKCHAEGFVECVLEHVKSLVGCNKRGVS